MALTVGLRADVSVTVGEAQTAAAFGACGIHVFGTPVMIGLMENAAWTAVQRELPEGDTTVGSLVNVRHLAATPLGGHVIATAELVEIDGRRLVFRVSARDDKQLIGEGVHERFRVNQERFMARVRQG
jgi:fluoroacetyl-CoA thioesterase